MWASQSAAAYFDGEAPPFELASMLVAILYDASSEF
jgi:hypothetical protein